MSIIYRYLFKDLVIVTVTSTAVLTFLLVILNMLKDVFTLLLKSEVPFWLIVKLVALLVPFVLTFTLPWGVLMAVLIVFGRFSQDKELLALKASGIGLLPIIAPAIVLGIVSSAISFWINAYVGPESRQTFKQLSYEILASDPMVKFREQEVLDDLPNRILWFSSKEGSRIQDVMLWEVDKDRVPLRAVRARSGEIRPDFPANKLVVILYDARIEDRGRVDPTDVSSIHSGGRFAELPIEIPLDALFKRTERVSVTMETFGGLLSQISDPKSLALDNPTPALTELQKRISQSIASFTFVLIGIPLAIQAQRRETSVGVALSLLIVLTYYVILITADAMKQYAAAYPEIIIWLPNIIFQALGVYLIARVNYTR